MFILSLFIDQLKHRRQKKREAQLLRYGYDYDPAGDFWFACLSVFLLSLLLGFVFMKML